MGDGHSTHSVIPSGLRMEIAEMGQWEVSCVRVLVVFEERVCVVSVKLVREWSEKLAVSVSRCNSLHPS